MRLLPTSTTPVDAAPLSSGEMTAARRATVRLTAVGGMVGAIVASSCCVLPLVFVSIGVTGAWIGNLTALAPYQPFVLALTAACLGYGFYRVYWRPKYACAGETLCARPLPNRFVKIMLWLAVALVGANFALSYAAPFLLDT